MKKRVFTYSIIAALALTLMVPVIAFSQMGPRRQGPAWAPQPFAAQDFARSRGRADGAGARRGGGFGREFGEHRGRDGSFSGARFGDSARWSLTSRVLARADALGLTADQEQQIRETRRAYQDASIERRAAMQVAQLDMRELMRAAAKDLGAIEAKLRELSDVEKRLGKQTPSDDARGLQPASPVRPQPAPTRRNEARTISLHRAGFDYSGACDVSTNKDLCRLSPRVTAIPGPLS